MTSRSYSFRQLSSDLRADLLGAAKPAPDRPKIGVPPTPPVVLPLRPAISPAAGAVAKLYGPHSMEPVVPPASPAVSLHPLRPFGENASASTGPLEPVDLAALREAATTAHIPKSNSCPYPRFGTPLTGSRARDVIGASDVGNIGRPGPKTIGMLGPISVKPGTGLDGERFHVKPTPFDKGTLLARVDLGPSHFLEFRRAHSGPPGISIVEYGSEGDTPIERKLRDGTPWQVHDEVEIFQDFPAWRRKLFEEFFYSDPGASSSNYEWQPWVEIDDWSHRIFVAREPRPTIEPVENGASDIEYSSTNLDRRSSIDLKDLTRRWPGTSATSRPQRDALAARWNELFAGDDLAFDPDSIWSVTNKTNARVGAVRTSYYQVAGQATLGTATLSVAHFDYRQGSWVNIFETGLGQGHWAIYSRRALAPRWRGYEEVSYLSGIQSTGFVNFVQKFRRVPTYLSDAGRFPKDWAEAFANDIQGVTHDDKWWYLSRTVVSWVGGLKWEATESELARVRVDADLSQQDAWQKRAQVPNDVPGRTGAIDAAEPEPPAWIEKEKLVHYGDLTFARDPDTGEGHLFAAIERVGGEEPLCGVGVFTPDLKPIGLRLLSRIAAPNKPLLKGNCGWIAYNPRDQLFYLRAPGEEANVLARYSIKVAAGAPRNESATGDAISVTRYPDLVVSDSMHFQGAAFSERGILWGIGAVGGDLVAIDVSTGFVYYRAQVEMGKDFETEGVTVWDLTNAADKRIGGHIHIQLLQNHTASKDSLTFWHLRAIRPEAL